MNISRNQVPQYHFSSALGTAATGNIILNYGSVDNITRNIYVSDLKLTNSSSGPINMRFLVRGAGAYGKPIILDVPGNAIQDFRWEMPYKFQVIGSTTEKRPLVGSVDAGGFIRYAISGYTEQP